MIDDGKPVIYYDGTCILCNRVVQFVWKHDRQARFLFGMLQSERGKKIRHAAGGDPGGDPDSVILVYRDMVFTKSAAVIEVCRLLGGVWKLAVMGYLIPRVVRDRLYELVANNRYRWFGRSDECMLPSPAFRKRLVGDQVINQPK